MSIRRGFISSLTLVLSGFGTLSYFSYVIATTELSDIKKGAISQNCATIRQSLKNLQKTDSSTRIYLGATYQSIISNFLAPLNLRLIKDNEPHPNFASAHSNLILIKEEFNQSFIKYSQQLEELIATDCKSHPEEFYQRLQSTRKHRAELSRITERLKQLANQHLLDIQALKTSLEQSHV
ncbi:MAG: hypothetical protein Q4A30_00085 [Candidatus Saccharibacteria bacterium]|nr:hypothetical protein [Candidatus Saccharibacteria bacterium]